MIGPNRFLFAEQGQSSAAAGVYVMYVNVHRCLLTPARVRHGTRGPAVAWPAVSTLSLRSGGDGGGMRHLTHHMET